MSTIRNVSTNNGKRSKIEVTTEVPPAPARAAAFSTAAAANTHYNTINVSTNNGKRSKIEVAEVPPAPAPAATFSTAANAHYNTITISLKAAASAAGSRFPLKLLLNKFVMNLQRERRDPTTGGAAAQRVNQMPTFHQSFLIDQQRRALELHLLHLQ